MRRTSSRWEREPVDTSERLVPQLRRNSLHLPISIFHRCRLLQSTPCDVIFLPHLSIIPALTCFFIPRKTFLFTRLILQRLVCAVADGRGRGQIVCHCKRLLRTISQNFATSSGAKMLHMSHLNALPGYPAVRYNDHPIVVWRGGWKGKGRPLPRLAAP